MQSLLQREIPQADSECEVTILRWHSSVSLVVIWFPGKMNLAPGILKIEFLIFWSFLAIFCFLFLYNHSFGAHRLTEGCPEEKIAFVYFALWLLKRGISIAATAPVLGRRAVPGTQRETVIGKAMQCPEVESGPADGAGNTGDGLGESRKGKIWEQNRRTTVTPDAAPLPSAQTS
jgi:hypothetical protein